MTTATRSRKPAKVTEEQAAQRKEETNARVEALMAQLNDNVTALTSSKEWTTFLRTLAKFYNYSANNVLLMMIQAAQRGYALSRVANYKTWTELGRHPLKGEGLSIFRPNFARVIVRDSEGNAKLNDDGTVQMRQILIGFSLTTAWDYSKTEGEPLPDNPLRPEWMTGNDSAALWNRTVTLIRAEGYRVTREGYSQGDQTNGHTDFTSRTVNIAPHLSKAHASKTLIHELAHIRANHEERMREITRDQMETEAESIAYVVLQHFGMDSTKYSAPYVAGWSKGDPEVILTAARIIRTEAVRLIDELAG